MKFNEIFNSQIFSILIIFLLVFSIFSGLASSLKVEGQNTLIENNTEYIIEFADRPLFQHINSIKNRFTNNIITKSEVSNYREFLLKSHKSMKDKIISLFDEKLRSKIVFSGEFFGIFNGLCIKNIPENFVEKIKSLNFVKDVFPNYHLKFCLDESVPLINAPQVWKLYDKYGNNIRGSGVRIAILDTGMDYNHPDLADSYVMGYDFVNNDTDPMDDNGHGTHVAGILAGNGISSNERYVGVAPDADLYVYKILDDEGNAGFEEFIKGIEAAIDPNNDSDPSDHVDIISLSFGTDQPGKPNDEISSKIDEVVDMGVVVVAAAGNGGPGAQTITSPGAALKAITVGSVSKSKYISITSSRGPINDSGVFHIKPDVVAPGIDITSTRLGGGYVSKSGTSMATPHVAGAAALLLQVHPDWTPAMIKNELESTAEDLGATGKDNTYGSGLINIFDSVNLTSSGPIAILNTPYTVEKGLIDIKGTAMNGTGTPEDFVNYSMYYKKDSSWIKICESDVEVFDDVLCQWNTTNLESGIYKIKLQVVGNNRSNIVIKDIAVGYDLSRIIISAPAEVTEKEIFKVDLIDINGDPVDAFVLLFAPFSIPRLKYGSSMEFKAPIILNPFIKKLNAKIFVFKIESLRKEYTNITILN